MKKLAGQDRNITAKWRPATQAIRGGTARSHFGETSEAMFLTSGYAYDCAADAAARFAGEQKGMTYSRLQNPTVEMLEERISLMEGAEATRCMAIGHGGDDGGVAVPAFAGRPCRRRARRVRIVPLADRHAAAALRHRDRRSSTRATMMRGAMRSGRTPRSSSSRRRPTRRWTSSIWRRCAAIARERGIVSVVDNAFATPVLAAADGIWRRHRRLFGDQDDGRAGARAGRRGVRHATSSSTRRCSPSPATPGRRCRRSTPGWC